MSGGDRHKNSGKAVTKPDMVCGGGTPLAFGSIQTLYYISVSSMQRIKYKAVLRMIELFMQGSYLRKFHIVVQLYPIHYRQIEGETGLHVNTIFEEETNHGDFMEMKEKEEGGRDRVENEVFGELRNGRIESCVALLVAESIFVKINVDFKKEQGRNEQAVLHTRKTRGCPHSSPQAES